MSVKKMKGGYYLRIRLFDKQLFMKTLAQSMFEARQVEVEVLTAARSGDYSLLTPKAREFCIRMFEKQGWSVPQDLVPADVTEEQLTLWKAVELFLNYPEIKNSRNIWRHEISLVHLVEHFGKDKLAKELWVPEIKKYQMERLVQGAKQATVNKEISTLSRLMGVLVEHKLIQSNPCRLVKQLSEKSGERQVYLSFADVERIVEALPHWCRGIAWMAYYTGMRQGEILGLNRNQLDLRKRIIILEPSDTKEGHWKKVPIHRNLMPILDDVLKVQSLGSDRLFLVQGRPPHAHSIKNAWRRTVSKLDFDGMPRFHDLRHTWKTNARRSGVDPEIRERILGHGSRGLSVSERYGVISDQELVQAIDLMTFDHGETEIRVAVSRQAAL